MDNRERTWYEAKYKRHPPSCRCSDCEEARKTKEQRELEIAEEQAKMRVGADQRVKALKEKAQQRSLPKIDWSWLK